MDRKAEIEELQDSIENLVVKEEILWKQRGKTLWLAVGDRNMSFFHAKANEGKVRKEIRRIRENNGAEVCDREGVQRVILDYFRSIFASTCPTNEVLEEVLGNKLFIND
ncbi:UNVERIFIED_CONTAM: hypothetical protein Sradi_0726500 [Sesamum radiatum]|uniref:Uncharacterized protein n=1 Tax=Sesamum radiatum TaxID=300843 RepID=A0AAW2VNI7_SESRA